MSERDKAEKKASGSVDPDLVRELAHILRDSGLSEIEVSHGETRLRLTRAIAAAPLAAAPSVLAAPAPMPSYAPPPAQPPPIEPEARNDDPRNHPGAVHSPMVGTVYLSPEPGAAGFVKIGDSVTEGQTLLMVEAMKTFNPIPAPRAGRVARMLVGDGQPVEFGQPLVILE